MTRPRSPIHFLLLTVFIDMVGFGIIIPVLPLYAEHLGASPVAIGWLTGIYFGAQIIFTPILGRLSDHYGRRPVLVLSLAGTAIGFLIMGMARSLALLFAARILAGLAGGSISIRQAYVADLTEPETRAKWIGTIGAAFSLGYAVGPLIGGLMSRISYSASFYFAAVLAIINVTLVYFVLPESLSKEHRAQARAGASLLEAFRHGSGWMFGVVVATYFFLIAGFRIMLTFFPLLTERRFGYDARMNGYLFAFMGLVTVIVQGGLIGRLVEMLGETKLARIGLFITAISLAFLPVCRNLAELLVICAGLSLGIGCASPTLNGLASRMIERGWQGRVLGVMQAAGSSARLLGPLLGGWLLMIDLPKPIAQYGRTPFSAAAILCFIGGALAFWLRTPAKSRLPGNGGR